MSFAWVTRPELCLLYFKKKLHACRWECISSESSRLLLDQIKPRLVLSGSQKLLSVLSSCMTSHLPGHTHHGCNTSHGSGPFPSFCTILPRPTNFVRCDGDLNFILQLEEQGKPSFSVGHLWLQWWLQGQQVLHARRGQCYQRLHWLVHFVLCLFSDILVHTPYWYSRKYFELHLSILAAELEWSFTVWLAFQERL